MSIGSLLRFARQVVANVLSQLTQQFNIVQNQALQPMRMMIQQVTGGVWVGDGADAFVQEVSSLMIPGVGKVGENITTMQRNLNRAIEVMDRADQQVNNMVRGLADVFNGIYR
ncbi:MAG: WXG100 family type VII secretion target [Anaerolinea sp.]|nr:WXG100 family type VII secretion target [Anaerolinea sp.]HRI55547.1 WXG100 family type VII secretion target [Anaerolineae bacterium]